MATSTTNLGLTKPAYSDDADIADINDNMDILDAKIGAVGNTSVQNQINSASASISANAQNIGKLKDDVAITEDGDTATHSISTGQYVIWKGDMYKATQNIAVSATLSSSNLDSISSGVSNDLGYKLSTHNHDDRYYTESEIDTQIGTLNQALQTHNHDDRYYTESEIDTQVAGLNARIDALDPEQGVGIFTDVAFSIPLSSWTASNNVWTYTYVNPVITARSGIDVIYDSSYRTAMKGDVDIVKNTGNIVFTTNRQPVGSLSGTVRVFDSVQGVLTTDKGGTGGTTAQAARENLGIYANNIQMSSSDNTSVSSAIGTNSTAIANVQNGLAYIVGNTNTTGATLAVGQFVYVKNHSTIAEGLRTVTASISANGNITTSNTTPCSEGGLNALNSKLAPYVNTHPKFTLDSGINNLEQVSDATRIRSNIYVVSMTLKIVNSAMTAGERKIGSVDIPPATNIAGTIVDNNNTKIAGGFMVITNGDVYINLDESITTNHQLRLCSVGLY